jgi:hypothetical protein
MQNVTMERKGDTLVITVNMKERFGASTSGKSVTIASTRGNAVVPGPEGAKIGLNIYVNANSPAATVGTR